MRFRKPRGHRGPARIAVTLDPAAAHDQYGNVTVPNLTLAPGYPSLKEARQTCDFEGEVTWVVVRSWLFTVDYLRRPDASCDRRLSLAGP
jgi:hypothetical protein